MGRGKSDVENDGLTRVGKAEESRTREEGVVPTGSTGWRVALRWRVGLQSPGRGVMTRRAAFLRACERRVAPYR